MGRSRRYPAWCLMLLVWATVVPPCGQAADDNAEPSGELAGVVGTARYRASVFAYHESGTLLWLYGPADLLRLEIREGAALDTLPELLAQRGQGWTVVLGGSGQGTLNAWGERWHRPPWNLRSAVQVVTAALAAGPPDHPVSRRQWRSASMDDGSVRVRIGSLGQAGAGACFRRRMSGLGLGRGGQDEVLELRWAAATSDSSSWLRVRSTRRPGQLELAPGRDQTVMYAMPETFVPLWPLSQLVEIIRK